MRVDALRHGFLPRRLLAMGRVRFLATAALAGLLLGVGACGGLRPLADVERDGGQRDWLCEGTAAGDGWECTPESDEALAAIERTAAVASPSSAEAAPPHPPAPTPSQPPHEAVPGPDAASPATIAVAPEPAADQQRLNNARVQSEARSQRPDAAPSPRDAARPTDPVQPRQPPASPPPPSPPTPSSELPLYRQLAQGGEAPADPLALPANFYALQLLAMSSQEALDSFAAEQGLSDTISTRVARDGDIYYVLLAGIYADQDAAEQALASLPPAVRALRPWIRPLGLLQQAIRQVGGHRARVRR